MISVGLAFVTTFGFLAACVCVGKRYNPAMIQTLEAVIDEDGTIRLLEDIRLPASRRALVTILEDPPGFHAHETALLSEAALARDWNRPEEDEAWAHLQQAR
jgi:hypothetical protein